LDDQTAARSEARHNERADVAVDSKDSVEVLDRARESTGQV
jgi:hypothetical protein